MMYDIPVSVPVSVPVSDSVYMTNSIKFKFTDKLKINDKSFKQAMDLWKIPMIGSENILIKKKLTKEYIIHNCFVMGRESIEIGDEFFSMIEFSHCPCCGEKI